MSDDSFMRLLRIAEAQVAEEDRKVEEMAALIGHNGGSPMEKPFGIDAPWLRHADEDELARLVKLQARITRRQLIHKETIAERTKIMNRCIRRMRRSQGKN